MLIVVGAICKVSYFSLCSTERRIYSILFSFSFSVSGYLKTVALYENMMEQSISVKNLLFSTVNLFDGVRSVESQPLMRKALRVLKVGASWRLGFMVCCFCTDKEVRGV